jgi:hypothetical protein
MHELWKRFKGEKAQSLFHIETKFIFTFLLLFIWNLVWQRFLPLWRRRHPVELQTSPNWKTWNIFVNGSFNNFYQFLQCFNMFLQ